MAQSTYVPWWEADDVTTIVVTPTRLQTFARCPLHYHETFDPTWSNAPSRAVLVGQYVHALIQRYNTILMTGCDPVDDDLLARVCPPPALRDTGTTPVTDVGRESLAAYRTFLHAQELTTIVDAERYIRTPGRPVLHVPRCAVIFSGRLDVVGQRDDDTGPTSRALTSIDVKTGMLDADLAAQPATWVQDHLLRFAYGVERIEHIQLGLPSGRWVSARLTPDRIEGGIALTRRFVASIKEGAFEATPGPWCGYCAVVDRCPIYRDRGGFMDAAF